jgi:Leucine-rich repeat (LRR) protein
MIVQVFGVNFSSSYRLSKDCINVEVVNLSQRGISTIELRNWPNLRFLNLSGNTLEVLQEKQFWGMPKLERLDLSYNKIELIHPRAFDGLKHIEYLNLSRNGIIHLPGFLFESFEKRFSIDLQYNRIIGFPRSLFRKFGEESELLLAGNKCVNKNFNQNFFRISKNSFKDLDDAIKICHKNFVKYFL